MATQKEQGKAVVTVQAGLMELLQRGGGSRVVLLPAPPGVLAADFVDQATRRDSNQPAFWALRQPLVRPGGHRLQARFLDSVFAGTELTVAAHHRPEHL